VTTPMCPECSKGDAPLCEPCRLLAWAPVWARIDAHGCASDDVPRCDECDKAVWVKWTEINADDDLRRAKMRARWEQLDRTIEELEQRYGKGPS
jgi:hypothetical protein